MKLPPGFIDEIKSRLPLSTLVGKRVSFDPARSMPARRDYWGCCPFHKEDTPSFHVLDGQGYYKCFGCGASGDHVKFVQELEGLDFLGAVEFLARE
ncbi:MAG: CHC2 zinc finger domain-containing protein, partial [Pseudomonadota bacterium]